MPFHVSKRIPGPFDDALARVSQALTREGFDIVSDLDMRRVMRDSRDRDFRGYRILGACHRHLACDAVLAEDKAGLMVPFSVVVQESRDETVEILALDPEPAARMTANRSLTMVARALRQRLDAALKTL